MELLHRWSVETCLIDLDWTISLKKKNKQKAFQALVGLILKLEVYTRLSACFSKNNKRFVRARVCDSAILPSVLPHYCEDSSTAVHSRVSLWGSSSPSHGHPRTPWRTCSHSWGCLRSRPRASLGEDLWGEQHDCTHSWKAHPLCRPGSRRSPLRRHLWHTWMPFLDCLQIQIPHDIWNKTRVEIQILF